MADLSSLIEQMRAGRCRFQRSDIRRLLDHIAELEARTIPDGWVAVPRNPYPEMLGAWYRYKSGFHFHDEPPPPDTSDVGAYAAMLAALPSSPKRGQNNG